MAILTHCRGYRLLGTARQYPDRAHGNDNNDASKRHNASNPYRCTGVTSSTTSSTIPAKRPYQEEIDQIAAMTNPIVMSTASLCRKMSPGGTRCAPGGNSEKGEENNEPTLSRMKIKEKTKKQVVLWFSSTVRSVLHPLTGSLAHYKAHNHILETAACSDSGVALIFDF
jgi:hypothetical protein